MPNTLATALIVLTGLFGTGACSSSSTGSSEPSAPISARGPGSLQATAGRGGSNRFPDVIKVVASRSTDGTWAFDVTMTSAYDTPERYADGWRVTNGEAVLAEMTLGHDHASEQPFTRTQTGVAIPDEVTTVTVQGHDRQYGYGGATQMVSLVR